MSAKSAKLKFYGFMFVGVIGTLHIGSSFIKPLVDDSNKAEKMKAASEHLDRIRKI